MKATKYSFCGHYLLLSSLHNVCLNRLHLCSPISLVESRRYYPTPTPPPPPPPPGGGGGRFKGFLPNPRPPGGPFRGGAQGGNPSDRAPYQGPQPVRSHKGAPSSLLYQDKNLTVKAVKTPMTEKFTEIENSGKAVEVLTRGFIKLKSTAKTSSTASSPSSSSQNRAAEDKEKGSKNTSYNHGRSSRPCSSTNKQKPPSPVKEAGLPSTNTDVQNTSKDAVNSASAPAAGPGPAYTLASSSSSPADSVDVVVPPVLLGGSSTNKAGSYPKEEYTAAAGAALLHSFKIKGHPLNAQLEEQIKQFVPNNVTPTSKLWENMSLERLEDSLKQGSKEERIYRGVHFLEACHLMSVTEISGDKIEPRFYNHCKPSICSPNKIQLNLAEETFAQMSANLWIGAFKEPTSSDTVFLLPEQLHVHLFWNVGPEHPGQPQRVLSAGFFTSRGGKDTLVSPTQPFGNNKPQYFNMPANPVVMGIDDVSVLSKPKDRETAAIYLDQVRPLLEHRIKQDLFPLLKDPISLYSKEGLTLDHMNTAIHNIIQKEESELKLWLKDYNNKRHDDKEKAIIFRKVEGKKIDHPLAYKLFFHILNNAHEKTPITSTTP
jgi:hypothetical protein